MEFKGEMSELFKYNVYFEYDFDVHFMCHTSL